MKDVFILELSNNLPANTFTSSDVIISNQLPTYSHIISHHETLSIEDNLIKVRIVLNVDCDNRKFEDYVLKNFTFSCYNYKVGKYLPLTINRFE